MTISERIAELPSEIKPSHGDDVQQMIEDIYYHFTEMDDFEMLRIEETGDDKRMVVAACLSTMLDPFFKIVVTHKWQTDLAFDNQWSAFEVREEATIFHFITWEDVYVTGEIWFERVKREVQ